MEDLLRRKCLKWIRYRLNTYFLSFCLSHRHIPKGFRLKLLPSVPPSTESRQAFCSKWTSELEEASFKLMKTTCAFYATELPELLQGIVDLVSDPRTSIDTSIRLSLELHNMHNLISKRHGRKLKKFGLCFNTLSFSSPLPFLPSTAPADPTLSIPDVRPLQDNGKSHIVDTRGRRLLRKKQDFPTSDVKNCRACGAPTSEHSTVGDFGWTDEEILEELAGLGYRDINMDGFAAFKKDLVLAFCHDFCRSSPDTKAMISPTSRAPTCRVSTESSALSTLPPDIHTVDFSTSDDSNCRAYGTPASRCSTLEDFGWTDGEILEELSTIGQLDRFEVFKKELLMCYLDYCKSDPNAVAIISPRSNVSTCQMSTVSSADTLAVDQEALLNSDGFVCRTSPILAPCDPIPTPTTLLCTTSTLLAATTHVSTTVSTTHMSSTTTTQQVPTTNLPSTTAKQVSTINLTDRDLPYAYLSVLDKGKGFCPNPGAYNNFKLIQDTMDYTRRYRLKEYFDGMSPNKTDVPEKLYVKSTWVPPSGRNAALDLYCETMELDAVSFIPDTRQIRDNLSKEERNALRSMRTDASLTIRQADKGRRMVIMETEDYDRAINSILSNTEIYAPLVEDPTSEITKLIHTQVGTLYEKDIISEELYRCITWGKVECPHFYGLPKVHKSIPPGSKLPPMRGIISSVKGPTTRASRYLDSVLNPLVPAYCGDHWCKDTTHILQEIETLNKKNMSYSSKTHTLVAIDVVDMYNSIPHDEGIDACRDALISLSSLSRSQIKEILTLLKLVLTNNCFSYNGKFYRQIRGTAMGTPCAPAYANIFMAFLWKTRIVPGLPSQPEWLKRFLDDFLALFQAHLCLKSLLAFLNSVHKTVKFTATMGLPSTELDNLNRDSDTAFMDLSVHFSEGKLHTDLFSKPTDSHTYLSPKSCHPKHIFRSIVYSGALRLRRICSKDAYFCERLSQFAKHLMGSGYSEGFIHDIFPKVAAKARVTLLTPNASMSMSTPAVYPPASSFNSSSASSSNSSSANSSNSLSSSIQRGVTFVTTFHPRMHNVIQSHNTNFIHLQASAHMRQLFPHKPLIAMRRTANIGNLVIHTKPRDAPMINDSPGFHACPSSRCQIHSKFAILGPTVKSSRTGMSFPIKEHITCSSSRVIYVLTCRRCGSQYTGKTTNALRIRFNNERTAIRNHHKLKPENRRPYGFHFNLPDHDGENDLQIQGVEVVPEDTPILQRESFWLWQLKTHRITGGMNVAEDHFSGLTLSN